MRLPEDTIKKGILHPQQPARDAAVHYFASSALRADPSVMPVVVEALKTFGWEDAFEYFGEFTNLARTEDTFLWFMQELAKVGRPRTGTARDHGLRLSALIARADVGLLLRHKSQVLELPGLFAKFRKIAERRLHLLTLDTAACWRELEQFCEAGKDKQYVNDVNLGDAFGLVEALGRDPQCADRVLSLLAQKIDDWEHNPMKWMEPLAVRLAGELRLEAAIPLIVGKLHEDGDLVCEEAVEALTRIGNDAVVEAISKDWPSAPWHFRLFASDALGNLRSDLAVSTCLELWGKEEDGEIKDFLLRAMLHNFSSDAIEPARQWCLRGCLENRRTLVAVATLQGVSFPELPQWLDEERREAVRRKRLQQEWLTDSPKVDAPKIKRPSPPMPQEPLPQPVISEEKIGRNDPCPCGSGKKYKKCCLNKQPVEPAKYLNGETSLVANNESQSSEAQQPALIHGVFDQSIPTHEWFKGQSLDEAWNLQEAVEAFIYELKKGEFLTWEAVVCQEQGRPLTAPQKEALERLISFSDTADTECILYINEIPRPSKPWFAILHQIVPHLLMEPFVTAGEHWEVRIEGWPRLMQAVREHGQGLSLPPGVVSPEEIVPADMRHKLWLQVCFDDLCGLGQEPELNLKEQPYRIEEFIGHLREHKESVQFFGLTLESLSRRLILPELDVPLFVEMMQRQLSLKSLQEPIADHL